MGNSGSKHDRFLRGRTPVRPQRSAGRQDGRLLSSLLLACLAGAALFIGCGYLNLDRESDSGRSLWQSSSLLISPDRASVLGGTPVTIVTKDIPVLSPGIDVIFGDYPATEPEVVDGQTIRVTVPAHAAGQVDVLIRVTDETVVTSPAAFEYVAVKDADAEILAQIEDMFPGPPRPASAVATSNTSVRLTFSEPVGDSATEPSNYSIVIPEGGFLLLDTSSEMELSEDQMVVELTTISQSDVLYRLTVTGIYDLAGNPLAPPERGLYPAELTFTGIAPGMLDEHIDSDGDGFADWFEMLGWAILIELADGTRTEGYVTSNPFNPDTDGDGVSDADENARSMDPRTDDTDADLVLDADEIWGWRSNPCDQDSDDDGFSDMTEVGFGTSLILADTDGDQLDDRDELLNRSRNPHIADLPIMTITIGEMNLELDERYTYTDEFGQEHQVEESFSDTLQRDTSSSLSMTRSNVYSAHVKFGASVGIEDGKPKYTGEFEGGFAWERTNGWGTETSVSTSRTYNEAISRVAQVSSTSGITRETVGARLSATVTIGAASDIAFKISAIEISVLQQDPRDRSRLTPIATLVPNQPDAVYNVGPLAPEIGPLIFQNTDVFPSMVEELMKDPRGLVFKVANFNITDEFDRNFAFSGQEVVERTAMVTIDYGNGESEAYRVATAGRFDLQGRPQGISMEDALRAIELLPWEGEDPELGNVDDPEDPRPKPTDPDIQASFGMRTTSTTGDDGEPVDVRVLTRVRGVQNDFDLATVEPDKPNDGGFWVVFISTSGGQGVGPDSPVFRGTTNFDEMRLRAGETYMLAFVKDTDGDQLTSLEEFFSGSNDSQSDTDHDNLGDFLEVRGQWNADGLGAWLVRTDRLSSSYRAYSAPYMRDSDEDGLQDDIEYSLCRYRYEADGTPPDETFARGTYDDSLADPGDDDVTWDNGVRPEDLPYPFPPSDGLPVDWHMQIDPETGVPVGFPSNRASLDARKTDTDGDGINDGDEVNGYYVDLFDDDPTDGRRTRLFVYSDPRNTDTDGDGLLDGMERRFGTNPVRSDADEVVDDDLDGLANRVEEIGWLITINGVERHVFSNPDDPDSDNDSLPDYVEWVLGTSPWYNEPGGPPGPFETAPGHDTDQDGMSDYEEWNGSVPPQDQEKLAFCDLVPHCAGYQPSDTAYRTDPTDEDTDGDDLSDGDEIAGWTVHIRHEPAGYRVVSDPLNPDTDGDGWKDSREWKGLDGLPPGQPGDALDGTDPARSDTDEDGTIDSVEPMRVDSSGESRDPVTPDQRVTVTYAALDIIENGEGTHWGFPEYLLPYETHERSAIFTFEFGLFLAGEAEPTFWADSSKIYEELESCRLVNDVHLLPGHPDAEQDCAWCPDSHKAIRWHDGKRVDLISEADSYPDFEATRSYIMDERQLFWLKGEISKYEKCRNATDVYTFSFDDDVFVAPVEAQTFEYSTPPETRAANRRKIELKVIGFIEVD